MSIILGWKPSEFVSTKNTAKGVKRQDQIMALLDEEDLHDLSLNEIIVVQEEDEHDQLSENTQEAQDDSIIQVLIKEAQRLQAQTKKYSKEIQELKDLRLLFEDYEDIEDAQIENYSYATESLETFDQLYDLPKTANDPHQFKAQNQKSISVKEIQSNIEWMFDGLIEARIPICNFSVPSDFLENLKDSYKTSIEKNEDYCSSMLPLDEFKYMLTRFLISPPEAHVLLTHSTGDSTTTVKNYLDCCLYPNDTSRISLLLKAMSLESQRSMEARDSAAVITDVSNTLRIIYKSCKSQLGTAHRTEPSRILKERFERPTGSSEQDKEQSEDTQEPKVLMNVSSTQNLAESLPRDMNFKTADWMPNAILLKRLLIEPHLTAIDKSRQIRQGYQVGGLESKKKVKRQLEERLESLYMETYSKNGNEEAVKNRNSGGPISSQTISNRNLLKSIFEEKIPNSKDNSLNTGTETLVSTSIDKSTSVDIPICADVHPITPVLASSLPIRTTARLQPRTLKKSKLSFLNADDL